MKAIQAKVARATLWSIVLLACSGAGPLLAGALAPTVVSGQASFQRQGSVYSITNTPGAIIQWPAFSVGSQRDHALRAAKRREQRCSTGSWATIPRRSWARCSRTARCS